MHITIAGLLLILIFGVPVSAQTVTVHQVPLDQDDPYRDRIDNLIWRGGLEIVSSDKRFGGLSGLHVSADGKRLIAVSDRGHWITARLRYRNGVLTDLDHLKIGSLRRPNGKRVRGRRIDAESLAVARDGNLLVAFERRHRIVRYSGSRDTPFSGRPRRAGAPPDARSQTRNKGIEALTTLCDGRLFALSEGLRVRQNSLRGWIGSGTQWRDLEYIYRSGGSADFRPSGATTLANCDVLLIEHIFTLPGGVRARLTRLPARRLKAGSRIRGEIIATLEGSLTVDNMEGIAARQGPAGQTLVYLISDDNFSVFQRTLLMMFELAPAR
ncbi:MAG: esterase-like activity of phytase family protein [Alphaproteobacteria bacterium]|nr:esterase-like activity of phytase family protein [Alphaproteobacteria bacterium]